MISIMLLTSIYIGIALIAAAAEKTNLWSIRIAALPLIAALQNHLQILLHEGVHFQIHPNRKWNEKLTEIFCAIPFLGLLRHYRHFHFLHHRHLTNAEKDPEIEFYFEQGYQFKKKTRRGLAKMLFLDFCGYHYFQFFVSYNRYLYHESRAGRIEKMSQYEWISCLLVAIIVIVLIVFDTSFELVFYWFLPQFTFLFLFLKLQGYGEHGERSVNAEQSTYFHEFGWLTRFFIYPLNSHLHLEHHLYPSVPWYRLWDLRNSELKLGRKLVCKNYFFGNQSVLKKVLLHE